MQELTRYFPKELLQLAWEIAEEIAVTRAPGSDNALNIEDRGPLARDLLSDASLDDKRDKGPTALAYKCLGAFMRQGPIIVRPKVELCTALHETEIRLKASDLRMPFPIMAVELPREVADVHAGSLTFVWRVFHDLILVWTMSVHNHVLYHTTFGDDLDSLEDRLIIADGVDTEDERRLVTAGGRVALNLVMLAAHRQTAVSPLPPKVVRHRAGRDERLRVLAARHLQELTFRDLILEERPGRHGPYEFTGRRLAAHIRRGHWKRVVHGPKGSLRKWGWVEPYWAGSENDGEKPTVILE